MIVYNRSKLIKGFNMKKVLYSSIFGCLIVFSGCSQKEVSIDNTQGSSASKSKSSAKLQSSSTPSYKKLDDIKPMIKKEDQIVSIDHESEPVDIAVIKESSQKNVVHDIYFEFDSFSLVPAMQKAVKENSKKLLELQEDNRIKLEGNCDEWGTDEYNYALGLKRAKSIKDALISEGIRANKILMVSYGESNPMCQEHTAKCWKLNRRVEHKLLP
jgi:peptidoglycan-associated lipoprotein